MTERVLLSPEYFPDSSVGRPISNGYIYVGIPNLDPKIEANQKQISVLQEDGSTVDVSQPLRTSAGGIPIYNGSPVTILANGPYSLRIDDSTGTQEYYVPSSLTISSTESIQTIADLKAITTSPDQYTFVHVLGYYAAGDGGGGPIRYYVKGQPPGTYVDNGGSIILPDGGDGSEAWLWDPYLTQTNIRWWGLSPSRTGAQNYASITNAVTVMSDVNGTGTVGTLYVDSGVFDINNIVDLTCNLTGEGTLRTETGSTPVPKALISPSAQVTVSNLTLDGNGVDDLDILRFEEGSDYSVVDNVNFYNAGQCHVSYYGSGLTTFEEAVHGVIVKNCYLKDAGLGASNADDGDAMSFNGAQFFEIHSNHIDGFTRIGIVFEGGNITSTNPHIHHNFIENGLYTGTGAQEPAGIWTENCNGRNVHNNVVNNIVAAAPAAAYRSVGIAGGGNQGATPADTYYPYITHSNKISNVYMGFKNPGNYCWGNSITEFQTGMHFTTGAFEVFGQCYIRDTYFGDTELEFDGAGWAGGKFPGCLFSTNAGLNSELIIDGVIVENVTRGTTADYDSGCDLFVSSIEATAIEKIEVKNVTTDIGFIARVEDDERLNKLIFENVPVLVDRGSLLHTQELLEFRDCAQTRGTPVSTSTHSSDEINFIRCTDIPNMRAIASSSAQTYVRLNIQECKLINNASTITITNNCFLNLSDNTFDGLVGPFISSSAAVTRGHINSNILINLSVSNGSLGTFTNAGDNIAANANTKDGAAALFTTGGGATITEANTVTV